MCGTDFRITDNLIDMNEDDIPKVLGKIVGNQQFIGSHLYMAPMMVPHKCGDGNGGLAHMIGLRQYHEEHSVWNPKTEDTDKPRSILSRLIKK